MEWKHKTKNKNLPKKIQKTENSIERRSENNKNNRLSLLNQ